MSIAGRVLAALVTVALLFWIALFAVITDWNKKWGEQVVKFERQLESVASDLPKVQAELDTVKAELTREQIRLNNDLMRFRSELSDREKLETESREALDRVNFQLASAEAAIKSAEAAKEFRTKEKADTEKAKAEALNTVETLKAAVNAQLEELGKLRDDFKKLLAENQEMLKRIQRTGPQRAGRVRSATLRIGPAGP
jgi:chromosome segregation ATPase